MSLMKCAAINCKSTEASNVSFFRFPEDTVARKKWVNAIYRGDWVPTKHDLLCSLHFPPEDFVTASNKKYLKSEAIPSITDIDETININAKSAAYVKEIVETNPPKEKSVMDFKVGSSNASIPIVVHLPRTIKAQFVDAPNTPNKKSIGYDNDKFMGNVTQRAEADPSLLEKSIRDFNVGKSNTSTPIVVQLPHMSKAKFVDAAKTPIAKPVGTLRKLTKKKRFIKQWPIQNIVLSNGQNARIVLRPKAYIIKPDGTFVKTKVIPELLIGENELPALLDENDAPVDLADKESPQILKINTTKKDFDVQIQKVNNASTIPNDDSDMVDMEAIITPKIIKVDTLANAPNLQLPGVKITPTTTNYNVFQTNKAASNKINASKSGSIINIDLTKNENLERQKSTTLSKISQGQPTDNATNGNLQIQMERRYYLEKVDHPKQKYVIKKIDVPQIKVDKKPPVPIIASPTSETTSLDLINGKTLQKVNIGKTIYRKIIPNVPASRLATPISASFSQHQDNSLFKKLQDQRNKVRALQQVIRRKNHKIEAMLGPPSQEKKMSKKS